GPNNAVTAGPDDPGSPWAIGSADGGHTAIHAELGTLADFARLRVAACEHGLELALDLAYQCAPDHPWVTEHPAWFAHRPDQSIRYAENPPKKYQDIYPINFETDDWEALWLGLKGVVDTWVERGVTIFRVDNPHTKAFPFWEWLIAAVHAEHPEVIFLAEAFTRPAVTYRLAKLGFTQSYTYFAWRYTKHEFEEYLTELTQTELQEFFRPNFWPNTPDILTEQLQQGTHATFVARLVLAATLAANYGIYGPAFELAEVRPAHSDGGSEEYLDSEKYEVRWRDLALATDMEAIITRVNAARRDHPALQRNDTLRFLPTTNDSLIAYTKALPDNSDIVLIVVNLDGRWTQSGFLDVPLAGLGLDPALPFVVEDLLSGKNYLWQGERNYVELDPAFQAAHVFHVKSNLRDEHDFAGYDQ
ncbi:MAG: alpha-1,4-glucan--maltose-1-phosphate maltosyltransferase, partial [Thermoleophilia bacterium]|nr:alpha-1,4-glucan--maltose-1-phosphate maltosyltransferase [Thermoleophilia bacterium]